MHLTSVNLAIENAWNMQNTRLLRVAGCALVTITFFYSCKDDGANAHAGPMPPPALPVITATVLPATTYQDFPASVEGKRDVEIKPQVDGYLTDIKVDEGQYVAFEIRKSTRLNSSHRP